MTEEAKRILEDVLKLSLDERAEIAAEAIASLDGVPEKDVEQAWAAEIERRIQKIRSGQAKGRPWDEVYDDLKRKRG